MPVGRSFGLAYSQAQDDQRTKVRNLWYFEIAFKSSNEAKYWLLAIQGYSVKNKLEAGEILKEVVEVSKIIGSSVLTIKGKKTF